MILLFHKLFHNFCLFQQIKNRKNYHSPCLLSLKDKKYGREYEAIIFKLVITNDVFCTITGIKKILRIGKNLAQS